MINPAQAAPMGKKHRVSSESAWPLRGPDGKTFAERRREQKAMDNLIAQDADLIDAQPTQIDALRD